MELLRALAPFAEPPAPDTPRVAAPCRLRPTGGPRSNGSARLESRYSLKTS
jgi:hypothetical protein